MAAIATRATTLHSLGVVRQFLTAPADMDGQIAALADAVTGIIEGETGRIFVTRSQTEVRNGDGSRVIYLRGYPIVSVTSVTVRATIDATPEVIGSSLYRVDAEVGRIELFPAAGVFPAGLASVTVVYSAGFGAQDAATLPAEIVDASLELIKLKLSQKEAGALAASQVSIGPNSFVVRQDIPWHIRRILDAWRDRTMS